MQSFLAIVIVLGVLIAFHEFGHFIVARLLGIGVHAFSLGFGPKLLSRRVGFTEYRLALVPLGGYVKLVGESTEEELGDIPAKLSFSLRPAWQRMLVVLAGPVFNFLLAFLIYWGIFWAQGQTMLLPVIGEVKADGPAAAAGVQPGDRVLAINGQTVEHWEDLVGMIRESDGNPVKLDIQRDGAPLSIEVTPEPVVSKSIFGEEVKIMLIGVLNSGDVERLDLGPAQALRVGLEQTWAVIALTVEGIVKIFERIVPLDTVGGPIMIAQMVSEQAKEGLVNLLSLTAIISINLGILNLLPIPVLDGGHILFYGIESITRRPINRRIQELTMRLGIILLVTLMLLAVYNDILRLIRGAGPV